LAWLQSPAATIAGETAHKGLGLSIVREIVARHDAEIQIESAPGAGTTFHIDFRAVRSAVAD
jgi:signal transduction histidine kinase